MTAKTPHSLQEHGPRLYRDLGCGVGGQTPSY